MNGAKELLSQYDNMTFSGDEEREAWLLETCREYDRSSRDDRSGRASLYNELGSFYRNLRKLDQAEAAYRMAIDLMETPVKIGTSQPVCRSCSFEIDCVSIEGNTDVYTGDYATILNNLAGCYRLQGRTQEALETFDRAYLIYASFPDLPKSLPASCKNNKGLVYLDKNMPEEAERCFQEALKLLDEGHLVGYELAMTYGNMAVAHYRMGRIEEALKETEQGLNILKNVTGEDAPVYQGLLRMKQTMEER